MLVSWSAYLLNFCPVVLSILKSGVLKSTSIIFEFPISNLNFVRYCSFIWELCYFCIWAYNYYAFLIYLLFYCKMSSFFTINTFVQNLYCLMLIPLHSFGYCLHGISFPSVYFQPIGAFMSNVWLNFSIWFDYFCFSFFFNSLWPALHFYRSVQFIYT